ncbi:hypothetical protein LXA43DRAFT_1098652 [Ganoderma leucocontextum]|nr:hypothetical protein LXA43DRAFT_1098652 [Ganoderma leucocontextum]
MSDPPPTDKRPRGRPKGTKNKPTAGKVGRPRKDGQPPRRRNCRDPDGGTDNSSSPSPAPAKAKKRLQATTATPGSSTMRPVPDVPAFGPPTSQQISTAAAGTCPPYPPPLPPATPVDTAPATPVATAPAMPVDTTSSPPPLPPAASVSTTSSPPPLPPVASVSTTSGVPPLPPVTPVSIMSDSPSLPPAASDSAMDTLSAALSPRASEDEAENGHTGTLHSRLLARTGEPGADVEVIEAAAIPREHEPDSLALERNTADDVIDNPYGSDLRNAPLVDEDEDEDLRGDEDTVEDELEDEFQPPGDEEEDSSSPRAMHARSTMPTWLDNEYQLICQKLRGEMGLGKAAQQLPDCYKRGTFREGVATQFPFHLTHRGGLSDELVALLRECFLEGIGLIPFTKLLRSLHYRRYDLLRVQYYEMARERMEGTAAKFLAKLTHFGEFSDRDGYAGYLPGHNYFARFHDALIEDWTPELQQLISMVSARILAIDHSFKVNKRMGKVKKTAIFSATHSTVNEYVEIRNMIITPTKAHDQFMPLLAQILATSTKFGHSPIEVIYTDNVRGDKRALETSLPPLSHEIVPMGPAQSNLEPLAIPGKWSIILLNTALQVDLCLKSIMGNHATDRPIEVALDMEWPVDLESGIQGCIAVIQIAYRHHIYLIQTRSFIKDGFLHLPNSLITFLRTSSYKKVGVGLDADFKRLYKDCGFTRADPPFTGQLDLGGMAKDRGAATRRNTSLVQLVETVLRRQLVKDPDIQVSRQWADEDLHDDFRTYAALDAVASWLVYEQLQTMDVIEVITATTPGGTPVTLIANDGRAVAHGVIALDRPAEFNHMKVTPSRSIVSVTEVFVAAYKVPASLLPSRAPKSLSAFGQTPFLVLYHTRLIHPRSTVFSAAAPSSSPASQFKLVETVLSETVPICDHDESNLEVPNDETTEQCTDEAERDPQSDAVLAATLAPFENLDQAAYNVTRSRVLGDIFHLHDQFPISKDHGLRRPFFRALSAALFISDAGDKAALEAVLHRSDLSYSSKLMSSPQWVLHRVRRYVPPPEVLLPRVTAVLKTFGPLKDAQTGLPLFNHAAWDVTKNILENIRLGYYSDPPGVQLYYEVGEDRHGLTLYRCCRGTNSVEGGVHQSLIHRFTSFNVSPRFAVNSLLYWAVCHNITNRVARLIDVTAPIFNAVRPSGRGQWINGNDYERAGETFGIMSYDSETQDKYHFLSFNSPMASELKHCNTYLARRQGTRYAVLPVHTSKERSVFHSLVNTSALFKTRAQPDWHMLAIEWSGHANGTTIFYKLSEHLKSYFKIWTNISNEKSSVTLTAQAIQHLRTLVQSETHGRTITTGTPATLSSSLKPPPAVSEDEPAWHVVTSLLNDNRTQQSSINFEYGPGDGSELVRRAPGSSTTVLASSRVGNSNPPPQKRRKPNPDKNTEEHWLTKSQFPLVLGPLC